MVKKALLPLLLALILVPWAAQVEASQDDGAVVNINSASVSDLALLPRVGPALASRIVEFRKANGKFDRIEDLLLVRGIGDKVFERLRPYLTLEGPTTLKEKVSASSS